MTNRRDWLATRLLLPGLIVCLVATGCSMLSGETSTQAGGTADETETEADVAGADDDDAGQGDDTGSEETTTSSAPTTAPPVEMPDLRGLTEAEARNVIQALGVDGPTIESQPSFEDPGTVLEQVPSPGRDVSGVVSLIVAESMPSMPDFTDQKIADVRKWADPLGVTIRTETVLTTDKENDQVIDQVPPAGGQVSEEILITLAETPTTAFLAKMSSVEGRYVDIEDIPMNGTLYNGAVELAGNGGWVAYNLSRDWSTLKVDIGVSDVESASALVQVEITGDGEVLYSEPVAFGTINSVEINVTDVLRLTITCSYLASSGRTYVGLGNAQLIGGASTGG